MTKSVKPKTELELKIEALSKQREALDDEMEVLQKEKEATLAVDFLKSIEGTEWTLDKYGSSLYTHDRDKKINIDKLNIWPHGRIDISENTYLNCNDGTLKIEPSPSNKAYKSSAHKNDRNIHLRFLIAFAKEHKIKVNLEDHEEEIEQCKRTIKIREDQIKIIEEMMKA